VLSEKKILNETKNNVLQSKYPPDIIGFCETIFHENISNDSLNINGFVPERKDRTERQDIVKMIFHDLV
jgi:hypothetical protein